MPRANLVIAALLLLGLAVSCKKSPPAAPVVVHVLRAPYFAADFTQANIQFAQTSPSVHSSRSVALELKDDVPYWNFQKRLKVFMPDVLILYSQGFVPDDPAIKNQLGASQLVCGLHPAFVPVSVSGDEREAAQAYVNFLVSHCTGIVAAQPTTAVQNNTVAQTEQPTEQNDPQRPKCTNVQCEKMKAFLKSHYCGESPFGNGPDDGCDIRGPKKTVSSTKLTADYICKWNDADSTSKCQQRGQVSQEASDILLRELRRLGLPAKSENEVHYTVLESTSGWSVMAGDYDHVEGSDLTLCEVIVAADRSGKVHVLREVPIKKTDADVPDVTTWSPVDIADVDGQLEIVLEGDAYENHWFEVVSVQDGFFKTVFSGLGYYL